MWKLPSFIQMRQLVLKNCKILLIEQTMEHLNTTNSSLVSCIEQNLCLCVVINNESRLTAEFRSILLSWMRLIVTVLCSLK